VRSRLLEGAPGRDAPVADEFPRHTAAERRADAAVHALGLTLGVAGCAALAAVALPGADLPRLVAVGAYAAGLLAMLGCSALYNLTPEGGRKRLFRRLDHAAIFLMIAGTYTPFTLVEIAGTWGTGLLAFVWTVAGIGIAVELLGLGRHDGRSVAAYLLLGWSVLAALGPLSAAVSPAGLALLVAGGVLYSAGVAFHLWTRLPYHNVVWHGFVLAAAACHYAAVLREVAA
jgi:hemolysin III